MKIGIFTALFQDRSLEEALRLAAEQGYEMVELPAFRGNPHLDLDTVLEFAQDQPPGSDPLLGAVVETPNLPSGGLSAGGRCVRYGSVADVTAAHTAGPVEVRSGKPPSDDALDQMILRQAMIASAVELLPDKLANVVILPLQLRLVYQIGQQYGQKLDANQIKVLAGTLGLGAAAQVMEGVVRKLVGGVTGGLFGGLVGGAGGMAAGVAVTFAATYALGHVAKQYYAQGRRLSTQDLRDLFLRFQGDAKEIFPKVQEEIKAQAKSLNLKSLLEGL